MRIAFVICGDLQHVSGGFHYDRSVIAGLRARGDEVDVIALPWRRPWARALLENLAPWPLRPAGYDVVVQDELCHPAVVARNLRLRAAGTPLLALVHNLSAQQPGTRARVLVAACERAYLRGVDGVIAVCAATAAGVRACARRDLPLLVAHAGREADGAAVDEATIAARAHAPGPLRLVFLGGAARGKGLHRLVAPLAALARQGVAVTLDIAGALDTDAGHLAQVRAAAAQAGIADRLIWHGLLDRAGVAALLARSHVLLLPSDREAYPLAALEALGAGLPVLASCVGGTGELLGGTGELLPPDDGPAWTAAIARLAGDRAQLAQAGAAAARRHAAHGTWADTAAGIAEFLRGFAPLQKRRRRT